MKLIRRFPFRKQKKKAFTLVEVILATSIFTIISLVIVMIFISVIRMQRRITLENALYEDGRFMMERIAREIRRNTIDYEEYYNRLVENGKYGEHFGCYATRFYNPGSNGPGIAVPGAGASKLGKYCSNPVVIPELMPGCVIDKTTLDVNTGQNPYQGISMPDNEPQSANAMCDLKFPPQSGSCSINTHLYQQKELYLIDTKGKQKSFFALKTFNNSNEKVLGLLRLEGRDADSDGIHEVWNGAACLQNLCCANGFDCEGLNDLEETLNNANLPLFTGFIPLGPLRTKITDLKFYISPLEDPRKAFTETEIQDGIQQQPHVTVFLTLQPAESELINFGENPPTLTLQTTVSSRVYNNIESYFGKGACKSYL